MQKVDKSMYLDQIVKNAEIMEKLTETWEEEGGRQYGCFVECKNECRNNHISHCQCAVILKVMKRLNEFEKIGLMPNEIEHLISERDAAVADMVYIANNDVGFIKCEK